MTGKKIFDLVSGQEVHTNTLQQRDINKVIKQVYKIRVVFKDLYYEVHMEVCKVRVDKRFVKSAWGGG